MTEEIQKRIEAIKAGKVPDGYKKAVVGIVPSEWQEKRLSDLLKFQNGVNAEKEKFNSGTKMISVMDILDERPIVYDVVRGQVDIDEKALNNYSVTYGDILFQRSSETVEDAGKSNVYLDRDKTATYSGFVIRGKKIADYDPVYLNELLKTTGVRKQIIKYAAGSQHINVSQDSLARVRVCLASKVEQQRIAEVLSKWGQAIELQEKLIEKLELQKKALMQNVFTVKPYWNKAKLGELCQINKGTQLNNELLLTEGLFKMINGGTIESGYTNESNHKGNTITISEGGNSCGFVNYIEEPFWCGGHCYTLDNVRIDKRYLFFFLKHKECNIQRLRVGSGLPNIQKDALLKFEIYYPDKSKMKLYASLFSRFQKKLLWEHTKLNALKQQQYAMRQLLLTGIVRV